MIIIRNVRNFNFESVPIDSFWNTGDEKELKMHRIHPYPAKFPAFITTRALQYAAEHGYRVKTIADIFCGCGTTAFEAKRNNIKYWGCDINPVATLIAEAKSSKYQQWRLNLYLQEILKAYNGSTSSSFYDCASERLKYWYKQEQFDDLTRLKSAISYTIPKDSKYSLFFQCAFSSILKATSVWLAKSIKPQVDPDKVPADVLTVFTEHCRYMIAANSEVQTLSDSSSEIVTGSFLSECKPRRKVSLIITSPPYVTSYEYADLHQLSALWLDYADDYRALREGTIGSLYHEYNFTRELKRLNTTGNKIVSALLDQHRSKAPGVAKYFLDMQKVAQKSFDILSKDGFALFVIGNTEYKDVRIDNAKHLAESLFDAGFSQVLATKRKISGKILTPYRDDKGKFSRDSNGRKVYSEEFILIGRK